MNKEDIVCVCVCVSVSVCVYIHLQCNISHKKKNEILPFATTWMDLEGIMLRELSGRER